MKDQRSHSLLSICFILATIIIPSNSFSIREAMKRKVVFLENEDLELDRNVRFFLYTRKNLEEPQQLWLNNNETITNSNYDPSKSTKFMTHGWKNNYHGHNCKMIKNAFLQNNDSNVIVIDWGNIAKLDYEEASKRVKIVGGYIAKMIEYLESIGSKLDDMTMAGHSLGAQVVGHAGFQMKKKIGLIVGLDPAGLLFELGGPGHCISAGDAQVVEIIHTAAGDTILRRATGDNDYYPNGGSVQPGCPNDGTLDCPHNRAYEFYAEAINSPNSWISRKCDNYENFTKGLCDANEIADFPGANKAVKTKGTYYLQTKDKKPFGLAEEGAKSSSK